MNASTLAPRCNCGCGQARDYTLTEAREIRSAWVARQEALNTDRNGATIDHNLLVNLWSLTASIDAMRGFEFTYVADGASGPVFYESSDY